jgi:hypothetical protein
VDDVHSVILGHEDVKAVLDALRSGKKADIRVAKRVRINSKNNQFEITSFFKKKAS